jgi:hypothetical protein
VTRQRTGSRLTDVFDERGGRFRALDGLIFIALALFATLYLWHSWDKWLHPITDSGRDLYIPEHLLAGKKLYRDILYEYPPLAPYLLAALVAVWGSSLTTYTWLGIVTAALVAWALYDVVRSTASRWGAVIAVFYFVGLHLTNKTAFGSNFIFPYSHAVVLGLLFLLWGVTFLMRFIAQGGPDRDFWIAVTFALLAAWSRLEFAATVAALFLTAFALRWVRQPTIRRRTAAMFAAASGAAFVSFLVARACFTNGAHAGTDWLRDNILFAGLFRSPAARLFHRHVDGTDFPLANALTALEGFALLAGTVILIRVTTQSWSARRTLPAIAAGFLLLVVVDALSDLKFFNAWTFALPTAVITLLIPSSRRLLQERLGEDDMTVFILLLVLAAASAPRIALRMAPVWYGFALFVPVYPLLAFVLFRVLPRLRVIPAAAGLVWSAIAVIIVVRDLPAQFAVDDLYRYPIDSSRGRFYDYDGRRANSIARFLDYARSHPIRSLVVVPDGCTINYFSRIDTSIRYLAFVPDHIDSPLAEAEIVRELAANPPDRILANATSMSDFGYGLFGSSYGRTIARWITANYVLEQRWPWMVLLEHRAAAGSDRYGPRGVAPGPQ